MSLPRSVLIAIAEAVERHGGDMTDVEDLVGVWERLNADKRGRADRLRYEAAHPACSCVDGGIRGPEARCERCWRFLTADQDGARPWA